MKTTHQILSTAVLAAVFVLAVTVLHADTERVIIQENEPARSTVEVDGDRKVRTTVTTVTETEAVPETARPTEYDPDDDIEIDVQMEDRVFRTNENVDGQIVVHNTTPEALPATFHVKLYHDDKLFRHVRVETEDKLIQPGISRYSLEEFGIPDLNKNRNYSGDWVIMVYQDDPATSEEEHFRVERLDI